MLYKYILLTSYKKSYWYPLSKSLECYIEAYYDPNYDQIHFDNKIKKKRKKCPKHEDLEWLPCTRSAT